MAIKWIFHALFYPPGATSKVGTDQLSGAPEFIPRLLVVLVLLVLLFSM